MRGKREKELEQKLVRNKEKKCERKKNECFFNKEFMSKKDKIFLVVEKFKNQLKRKFDKLWAWERKK